MSTELAERIARLSPAQRALLEKRLLDAQPTVAPRESIVRDPAAPLPLAYPQARLWMNEQFDPGMVLFNIPGGWRVRGKLNIPALQFALDTIVARHEPFRTGIVLVEGQPAQVIHPPTPVEISSFDLQALPEDAREAEAQRRIYALAERPFDLTRDVLLRVAVLQFAADDALLVTVRHHIAHDAWSIALFNRELAECYNAYVRGETPQLPVLRARYADFAVWQNERTEAAGAAREVDFWFKQLADVPNLDLPTDFPRPRRRTSHGEQVVVRLAETQVAALNELCRREGVTLFMLMLGTFELLLGRYTGQANFAVGTNILGRDRPEYENLIGSFSNLVALRADLSGAPTFREFLQRTRQMVVEVFAHRELPFERILRELRRPRDESRTPLFQAHLQTTQMDFRPPQLDGLTMEPLLIDPHTSEYDISLDVRGLRDGTVCMFRYSTDLFERATIERMIAHWQVLLDGICANPDTPIQHLPLLTAQERQRQLVEWNATTIEYPHKSVAELFEGQVKRMPDAIAVIDGAAHITYRELNARANRLARCLRSQGVCSETPVGVMVGRSNAQVVALLAILKAGGAFLPLDPSYPQARLLQMVEETKPRVVLTDGRQGAPDEIFTAIASHATLLEIPPPVQEHERDDARGGELEAHTDLNQLAYILYTSGSTGTPKGVMGTQRGIINRVSWMWREYPFAEGEICCQPTSLNFVDAIAEIFGPLLHGVPLVMVPEETVRDPNLFVELLAAEGVTRLTLLPSLLAALLNSTTDLSELARLKLWTVSGEPLDADLAREFYRRMPGATLLNLYGSSEAAADSTYFQVPRDWNGQRVPIGRPIANTQVYILDRALEPTPLGVQGELYVGGAGLARGYVGEPVLTAERFVPNPFGNEAALLYRTGDRARYLADGNIEYLGRGDLQVKVRGMRVELGEIEASLRAHPRVREAAVALHIVTRGDERLIAYVVTDGTGSELEAELRAMLQERLPAHMIPSWFIPLAELPRTPGGKVDRRALPEPLQENKLATAHTAPRDAVEAKLQTIWQKVLQVGTVGVADDFFEMGGHSLLAIVLFGEIEREFGTRLPVATLFQAPTIEQLAPLLRQGTRTREWSPLIPIQPRGTKPIFFCLHGFGGGVVGYGQLARLLGQDQPFYGLQARGQEDKGEPDDSIEAMADRYLEAIRGKQATGPYYLGGYCYGGTVAYEVARKLVAQGDTVRFLGMFENPAPRSGYRHFKPTLQSTPRFFKNLPYWAGDFLALEWKLKWRRVEREVKQRAYFRRMQTMLSERELPPIDLRDVLDDVAPVPQKHQRLIQVHVGAMVRYQPQPYNGRVTVFRTRRQPLFCSHDPFLGWKALASEVDVQLVAGSHHNLLEEPYVESLARELSRALALARGEG